MKWMQAAPALDGALFRKACGRFATGIAVAAVTAPDGSPVGMTVNSFTSVSCCPPLVLVCVDHKASALPAFRLASSYSINVLAEDQQDLSVRFAQRGTNAFDVVAWSRSASGAPVLDNCLATLDCAVTQTVEAGDHLILIGEVLSAEWREGLPLLYFGSCYRKLERNCTGR